MSHDSPLASSVPPVMDTHTPHTSGFQGVPGPPSPAHPPTPAHGPYTGLRALSHLESCCGPRPEASDEGKCFPCCSAHGGRGAGMVGVGLTVPHSPAPLGGYPSPEAQPLTYPALPGQPCPGVRVTSVPCWGGHTLFVGHCRAPSLCLLALPGHSKLNSKVEGWDMTRGSLPKHFLTSLMPPQRQGLGQGKDSGSLRLEHLWPVTPPP